MPVQSNGVTASFEGFVPSSGGQPVGRNVATGQSLLNVGYVTLSAGKNDVQVTGFKIRRLGLSRDADIKDITAWDGSTRISLKTIVLNGVADMDFVSPLTIKAGQSKKISIMMDIDPSASPSASIQLSFDDKSAIKTTSEVNGTFPAQSMSMEVVELNLGSMSIKFDNIPASVSTNSQGVLLENMIISASNEDIIPNSITFTQTGSAKDSDITNLKLYENDKQVGTAQKLLNGKVTFIFNHDNDVKTPYGPSGSGMYTVSRPDAIPEGKQVVFTLRGDIISGSGRNIKFEITDEHDVQATGEVYGTAIIAPNEVLLPKDTSTQIK